MKFATIAGAKGDQVVVKLTEETVIPLSVIDPTAPTSMIEVIQAGPLALDRWKATLECVDSDRAINSDAVRWRPPIPNPGKICGVALNNSASNDRKISAPDHPAFFLKPRTCLLGHGEAIEVYDYYGSLHPEPEVAVIIGALTRQVSARAAMASVFGYTICDDITGNGMRAEDLFRYYALYAKADRPDETERREQNLSYAGRYKGTDGFGPMGPWLTTRDEVPDPHDLDVECRVDGEVVAQDSTRFLNYQVPEVISFISHFHTLEPGDVISMGTAFKQVPGVKRTLHTANLQFAEGPIEITISGLGTLKTPVRHLATDFDVRRGWRLT